MQISPFKFAPGLLQIFRSPTTPTIAYFKTLPLDFVKLRLRGRTIHSQQGSCQSGLPVEKYIRSKSQTDKERHEHWMEGHADVKERATKATAVRNSVRDFYVELQKEDVSSTIVNQ